MQKYPDELYKGVDEMDDEVIIKNLEELPGNFHTESSTYISQENVGQIVSITSKKREIPELLITPFLIREDNGLKYELHYYETSIESIDGKTRKINFSEDNVLAEEITKNIVPKILIQKDEYEVFKKYSENYFQVMNRMKFLDDESARNLISQGAKLYYALY